MKPLARTVRFASRACREVLEREVRRAAPDEACGVLLGRELDDAVVVERVLPAANVHRFPRRAFEVDPGAIVAAEHAARAEGLTLIGYFHSHVGGPLRPSAADRRGSPGGAIALVAALGHDGGVALAAGEARAGALRVLDGP